MYIDFSLLQDLFMEQNLLTPSTLQDNRPVNSWGIL